MTIYDKFTTSTPTSLAEWLDEHGQFDGSPWMEWFDTNYCKKCEPILGKCEDDYRTLKFSYCELKGRCRFFPDLDHCIRNSEIIEMWLKLEVEEEPERMEVV